MESTPNKTIYINNLNEKIRKGQLKRALYSLFSQFGLIVDIVSMRTFRMRGQAWVAFDDVNAAAQAMRQMQGFPLFDKPMRIQFAKTKSDTVAKREGTYRPREKRKRAKPEEASNGEPPAKRTATASADGTAASAPAPPKLENLPPNRTLLAQNLPPEITEAEVEKLFSPFHGYERVRLVPGNRGIAFVDFVDENASTVALQALHNFRVSESHTMTLSYAKK